MQCRAIVNLVIHAIICIRVLYYRKFLKKFSHSWCLHIVKYLLVVSKNWDSVFNENSTGVVVMETIVSALFTHS